MPGSGDTAMLVAGTTAARWKKENGEQTSRKVAESFRVVSTKPTNLAKAEESDYRFYKAKVSLSSSQSTGGAQSFAGGVADLAQLRVARSCAAIARDALRGPLPPRAGRALSLIHI